MTKMHTGSDVMTATPVMTVMNVTWLDTYPTVAATKYILLSFAHNV